MTQADIALDPLAGTVASLERRGRSARKKGHDFERLIANMLTEATGAHWKRRVRQHGFDSDVVTDDPAFQHLSIECKHATRLCVPEWWRQACMQSGVRGLIPVLVYRQTGGPLRVQLDARDVSPSTFPMPGRHTVTLEWEAAMQWLRETVRIRRITRGDCTVLGE